MTSEEFFNKVKGKKIRWSLWSDNEYFIPESLNISIMDGVHYDVYGRGHRTTWFTMNGFEVWNNGGYWIVLDDKSKRSIKTHLPDFL